MNKPARPKNGKKWTNEEIRDIQRRAGIINEEEPINLSRAGRKSIAILEKISNLMVDLEDEIYDIRRVDKKLGDELLRLSNANDYVGLSNLIFRTF